MLGRILAWLFVLAVAIVFFTFLGVALYIGIFVFLILLLYGLFTAAKDEVVNWWHGRGFHPEMVKHNLARRFGLGIFGSPIRPTEPKRTGRKVIDMGQVEIIAPERVRPGNVLWKSREGLPLNIVYENSTGSPCEQQIRLFEINTRRGGAVYFEAICFADNSKCTLEMKRIVRIYDQDGEVLTPRQFLLKKGIG